VSVEGLFTCFLSVVGAGLGTYLNTTRFFTDNFEVCMLFGFIEVLSFVFIKTKTNFFDEDGVFFDEHNK
jgi:hypothetical protein